MTTFAEKMGKTPFEWHLFLGQETFTHDQLENAKRLADSWETCPCGNQSVIIPRYSHGKPQDAELSGLGFIFNRQIQTADISGSRKTLQLIGQRAGFLLSQLNTPST